MARKPKSSIKKPAIHRKGRVTKAKLGKPLSPNFVQNCTSCFNFYNCRDPDKSISHLCSRYSDISEHDMEEGLQAEVQEQPENIDNNIKWREPLTSGSEEDLEDFMMKVLTRPTDFGEENFIFDDSDLLAANNFLQFSASKRFLGQKPFAKQVEIGINFLQEYCPAEGCTDIEWVSNIPKKTSLNSIREKATLLKRGVCPRCGSTKSELVNNGDLVDHYELVGLAGQRCITGDSLVMTSKGIFKIADLMKGMPKGTSRYSGPDIVLENGKTAQALMGFVGIEKTRKITLTNGFSIRCTDVHPLMIETKGVQKWEDARYIKKSMVMPITVGQHVWGDVDLDENMHVPKHLFPPVINQGTMKSVAKLLNKIMLPFFRDGVLSFFLPEEWVPSISALLCNMGIFNYIGHKTMNSVKLLRITCPVSVYLFCHFINNSLTELPQYEELIIKELGNNGQLVPLKREYFVPVLSNEPTGITEPVYDFVVPGHNRFMANGILNHNSGKTALVGMLGAYITHLFLKTPNPAKTFGLTDNMIITCTYAAVTFQQALHNIWNPYIKPNLTQSPWFREYFKMMDYYNNKNPMPLYKSMDTFIFFYHKGLFMSPYTPDKRTLRGSTRGIAVIDELGWFDTNNTAKPSSGVRANSEETVAALFNSLGTLIQEHSLLRKKGNNNIPNPVMMNISSPSSKTDGICTRYNMVAEDPQMYGFHYPTWEMSPKYERSHQLIVSAFRKNPISAARDWGAEPPMSSNPFITNEKIFTSLVHEDSRARKNILDLQRIKITSNSGVKMTGAKYKLRSREPTNRLMTIDAGSVNNSFAIAIGRIDPETELPMLEGLGEIVPFPHREINFAQVYSEVISPLIEELGVIALVADRWQSKKMLQDAENDHENLTIQEYSLKLSDFIVYKDALMEGSVHLLEPEMPVSQIVKADIEDMHRLFEGKPVAHFIHQNLTVVQTIKTVDKGAKLTDDLFRCVVLMMAYLTDPMLRDDYLGGPAVQDSFVREGLGLAINQGVSAASEISGIGVSTGLSSGTGGGDRTFSRSRS